MGWQVLTVVPNAEQRVSRTLKILSFEHYIFRVRRRVVVRGKIVERLRPAFPGYVFIDAKSMFNQVTDCLGVIGFVKFGGEVVEVSEQTLLDLMKICDAEQVLLGEQPGTSPRFLKGDRVTVRSFAFDASAIFEEIGEDGDAIVLLDWFGRWVPTSVAEADLVLDMIANRDQYTRPTKKRRRRPSRHRRQRSQEDRPSSSLQLARLGGGA